jgi:hypothetical protein
MQRLCAAYVPPLCRLCNGSLKRRYNGAMYLEDGSCMCKRWIEKNEMGEVLQRAYSIEHTASSYNGELRVH